MKRIPSLVAAFLIASLAVSTAAPVSLDSLLQEMLDVESIARWPQPEFTCKQASSYDRTKVAPDKPGWFSNKDNNQFIRDEENEGRKERVMMDAAGPGAIVRFWLTGESKTGVLRIYLEGAPAPALTFNSFDLLDGNLKVGAPLLQAHPSYTQAKGGNNLYFPIPYARHCKVTWEEKGKGWRFYQINYRTYAAGTEVQTFALPQVEASKALIERVNRELLAPVPSADGKVASLKKEIAAGTEASLDLPGGPGAVRALELRLETADAKERERALRSVIVKLTFDDKMTAWVPATDFFGTGAGINALNSWYRSVSTEGAMRCRWVMPYSKSARVTLENLGAQPVKATLEATTSPWKWDDRSMYFHSAWRNEVGLKTPPVTDWNYIRITGRGVYAGDTLTLFNSAPTWYGEGDEKIWVDGESFPSHIGTGTEDYYGFSFAPQGIVQTPFANHVRIDDPKTQGWNIMSRTRQLDGIPFGKSLQFDIELMSWKPTTLNYAATTHWYAFAGATSNVSPQPKEAVLSIPTLAEAQAAGPKSQQKEFTVANKYLIMPIRNGGERSTIKVSIDGKVVRQYGLTLAASAAEAHWYAFFTIGNEKGKKAMVEATATEEGFALIKQSDTIPGEENFYREPHRPQFHFTQKVGWNNDPNGMVYHQGKWHLFFQHNPVGLPWGNMTWGHATSKDLLHWEQHPDKIFPKTMCKGDAFSGSAIVDKRNTGGWGENAMVIFLTDTGAGEAIAYSTDNGDTITFYDQNPVLKHKGRDPKVSWYAYGKDDQPLDDKAKALGGHWVMAVYDEDPKHGKNAAFYTSTNLKEWTEQSHLPGYFECTDLFQLPVDGDAKNTRWVVFAADSKYAVGQFDGKTFTPEHQGKHQVHYGPYYASQTFDNSPDGRRIQIGWNKVGAPGPYNQHFSIPTVLTLRKTEEGIRMFCEPIQDIEKLRVKTNKAEAQKLEAGKPVDLAVGSDLLDIRLTVEVGTAESIELKVPGRSVKYDVKAGNLNGAAMKPVDGKISVQVLVDRAIMEISGNAGRVFISGAGPGKKVDAPALSLTATGGEAKVVQFEAHEMKSIWNTHK